jgi:hypothetical protein
LIDPLEPAWFHLLSGETSAGHYPQANAALVAAVEKVLDIYNRP